MDLVLTLIQPNKLHMYLLENLGNFNIAHFRILKNYWKLIDIIITLWIWIFCFRLAVIDLCCYARAFSSCGESGLFSSCGARASHCGGFYCWGAPAHGLLIAVASIVEGHQLTGFSLRWLLLLRSTSSRASHCDGFYCWGAPALGLAGFSSCSSQAQ